MSEKNSDCLSNPLNSSTNRKSIEDDPQIADSSSSVNEEAVQISVKSDEPKVAPSECLLCCGGDGTKDKANSSIYFCQACIRDQVNAFISPKQIPESVREILNASPFKGKAANLRDEAKHKLELICRKELLRKKKNLKVCPRPDCVGYDKREEGKKEFICKACGLDYCYYCDEFPHPKLKCKPTRCGVCFSGLEKLEESEEVTCKECDHKCCPQYLIIKRTLRSVLKCAVSSSWYILGILFALHLCPLRFAFLSSAFWKESWVNPFQDSPIPQNGPMQLRCPATL